MPTARRTAPTKSAPRVPLASARTQRRIEAPEAIRWGRCPRCDGRLGVPMVKERGRLLVAFWACHDRRRDAPCPWWDRTEAGKVWSVAMKVLRNEKAVP